MERCEHCTKPNVRHDLCKGLVPGGWCECPCHTGEMSDPTVVREVQDVPSQEPPP